MYFIRRLCKYSSVILGIFDKKTLKKHSLPSPKNEVIFILGAPRTGSTILYQIITSYFNISYVDNLINFCKENLMVGFYLSNLFFKTKPHNSLKSDYGNTKKLHSPSEAGHLWSRWFIPNSSEFTAKEKNKPEFVKNINAVLNKYNRNLVIKNLGFGLRINFLINNFPNSKYIIIRRSPLLVAQSILNARKKNNTKLSDWWSIKPYNYKELKKKTVFEQIISQIYFIEKKIFEDLNKFDNKKIMVIQYENLKNIALNNDYNTFMKFIDCKLQKNNISDTITKLNLNDKLTLNNEEINEFEKIINNYDWDFKHNFRKI